MPRSVYDQSTGNPVQPQHLPTEPMSLEFAFRSANPADALVTQQVVTLLYWVSGVGLAAYWTNWWLIGWFPLNLIAVGLILHKAAPLLERKTGVPVVSRFLLFTCWIIQFVPMAWLVWKLATLLLVAMLAREVVRHFVFVSTASPLDSDEAWRLREQCGWWTVASSMPVIILGVGLLDLRLLVGSLTITAITTLVLLAATDFHMDVVWDGFVQAVHSWCTYNRSEVPAVGVLHSPCGRWDWRLKQLAIVVLMLSFLLGRLTFNVPMMIGSAETSLWHSGMLSALPPLFGMIVSVLAFMIWIASPVIFLLTAIFLTGIPAFGRLRELSVFDETSPVESEWQRIVRKLRESPNEIEQQSLYMGRLAADQSPLIVPRSVIGEHAHFLGDSGSGKTARGLLPLAEQLLADGQTSLMVVDLKGDSQELLSSLRQAAQQGESQAGGRIPVKYFTTREDEASFALNPFRFECWNRLNAFQKTDILCGALGLVYGTNYGEGYFSSANSAVLYATLSHFPETATFEELNDRIGYVISRPKAHGLDDQTKSAGNHVRMTITRLASFAALNVADDQTPSESVLNEAMDPARLFARPEVHYFHLSSMLGPGSSPEVGRLAIYMLLTSATVVQRNCPVYLIVDEFQRMAARNLDYMLQVARSMGVGILLANQSMQDLKRTDLIPVLETNCRYRQWFAVSGWEDQERLSKASGETIDLLAGTSLTEGDDGRGGSRISVTNSEKEFVAPRLTMNDIKFVGDDDRQSVVLINRGAGYSQFGGLPVIVESDFHITHEEFLARKNQPWPRGERGTFVPNEWQREPAAKPRKIRQPRPKGPIVTQETIDDLASPTVGLFDHYLSDHPGGKEAGR